MDSLNVLKCGSQLWKIRDKGHLRGFKFYCRNYSLSLDDSTVCYYSSDGNVCPTSSGSINLDDICEVRCGHGTDAFNALVKGKSSGQIRGFEIGSGNEPIDVSSHNCFSILFKEDHRPPLDLVAKDNEHRNCWVDCLSHLVVTIRSLDRQKEHQTHLRKMFRKADKNDNGMLTLSECEGLCEQLNMKMDASTVEDLFRKANKRNNIDEEEALDETEFVTFYYGLLQRPEIDDMFLKFATTPEAAKRMTPRQLAAFLRQEQRVELTVEECEKLVAAYEPSSEEDEAISLSVEGFTQFILFSELQNVTDPFRHRTVYQDMTRPLSHYWIASSHNTYLIGNQVTSDSSVEAYIKALKEGCRCVELDCWDGDEGEPIIYHGWTMTSKIHFKEVIDDAIRPYAFAVSDYPLILSIENHCSVEQQDVMADHLKTILGDVLFSDPVDQSLAELPSPEQLKRKVLIKAKKLGAEENDDEGEEDVDDERDGKRKVSPKKLSSKLSDLVNYVEAVHFRGFDEPGRFHQMSSFGESKAFGYFEDPETSSRFVTYNCRLLSRIYPGARRQDSSNFNPLGAWNCGCQIVALNYQTDDKQNFLNRAKFCDNGRCGYVLKPEFMTVPDPNYSPLHSGKMTETLSRTLFVTIVSGQHIPRPDGSLDGDVIDPYVKVRIRGHPDERVNKKKTERVKNNGFNPIWNEKFRFHVSLPSLAFLELRVKDHSKSGPDKDLAAFCCPFNMVQQGYRRVPLRRYDGRDLSPASLLVKIEFEN